MIAVIGGSGFENFEDFKVIEDLERVTPFGLASSGFRKVSLAGKELLFMSRHGKSHELTPSEINYPANIFALKREGAQGILSVSAVGSLKEEHEPGKLVLPFQFFDRTKGIRRSSFCGHGVVGHVSLAHPVCKAVSKKIYETALDQDVPVSLGGTYVCMEGPQFSTYAESIHYQSLGGDVIGMTNFPEVALAREAGISYIPMSFVTDYDCWDTSRPHVTLDEVKRIMKGNNEKAFSVIKKFVQEGNPFADCDCREQGLKNGLMTPLENLSAEQRKWLEVLRKG
ncbi:MAG: methylthioadenosine phosphorylase [Bdellovibrionaceae bacterium]|nr:methylthioadenosine phosphorylase [Pseudobdellovibrionaceae bacterium]|tara:strand:- start:216 stop:1064 length:849 start_codon:yes stop_codon:yes gene_type:complete